MVVTLKDKTVRRHEAACSLFQSVLDPRGLEEPDGSAYKKSLPQLFGIVSDAAEV